MDYIPVGRALGTHGLKGELKFRYYNEVKEDFLRYERLYLRTGDDYSVLELTGKRLQKGLFYIKIRGLDTPEEVFPLLNRELFVREEDLPRLEGDEFFDYQLVGLSVVDRRGVKAGVVKDIVHTRANDILVVAAGEEELFIPLVEEFIVRIDLEGAAITVEDSAVSS